MNKKCFQCDQVEEFTNGKQDFCDLCVERNKKSDKENSIDFIKDKEKMRDFKNLSKRGVFKILFLFNRGRI